jgi:HSP20 family protein
VRKEDISVEMSGRRLVVTGERKEKERKGILRRQTRTVGQFRYEVVLPGDVNDAGIEASLDHGVLSIRVPKADAERPRRITVQ